MIYFEMEFVWSTEIRSSVQVGKKCSDPHSPDNLWLASFSMCILTGATCHSWAGFMQSAVEGSKHDINRIDILPFINLDPTRQWTIYSALSYVQTLCEKQQLGIAFVTFDQPLFIKASEIVHSSFDLDGVVIRLVGFHLIKSLYGSHRCCHEGGGGGGIADLWDFMHLTLWYTR